MRPPNAPPRALSSAHNPEQASRPTPPCTPLGYQGGPQQHCASRLPAACPRPGGRVLERDTSARLPWEGYPGFCWDAVRDGEGVGMETGRGMCVPRMRNCETDTHKGTAQAAPWPVHPRELEEGHTGTPRRRSCRPRPCSELAPRGHTLTEPLPAGRWGGVVTWLEMGPGARTSV